MITWSKLISTLTNTAQTTSNPIFSSGRIAFLRAGYLTVAYNFLTRPIIKEDTKT